VNQESKPDEPLETLCTQDVVTGKQEHEELNDGDKIFKTEEKIHSADNHFTELTRHCQLCGSQVSDCIAYDIKVRQQQEELAQKDLEIQ
jgi:hypothetical protein